MPHIYKTNSIPNEWAVEFINPSGDGEIHMVLFSGPLSEERAREYALWKYPHEHKKTLERPLA